MPGIDGLEAARLITEERICGVLILTAFSQREVVEEARDAGALAYLVKPFQKSDLIPAIEVAIGRFRELQHAHRRGRRARRAARGAQADRPGQGHADGRVRDEGEDAFTFIQRTAMSERTQMRDVAERILAGALRP